MRTKLSSRKFWNAVVCEIAGLITLFVGIAQSEKFAIIAGAILAVLTVLGYLKAEKDIDVARIKKEINEQK